MPGRFPIEPAGHGQGQYVNTLTRWRNWSRGICQFHLREQKRPVALHVESLQTGPISAQQVPVVWEDPSDKTVSLGEVLAEDVQHHPNVVRNGLLVKRPMPLATPQDLMGLIAA